MFAKFKDSSYEEKYGVQAGEVGEITARETRDGESFLTVQFEKVEVNGVPSDIFNEQEEK